MEYIQDPNRFGLRTMVEIKLLPVPTKKKMQKLDNHDRQGKSIFCRGLPGKLEINLKNCKISHLEEIAYGLKDYKITTLRLICSCPICEILQFDFTDPTTSHILMRFFRELAQALDIRGWLKHLELGFKPWKRDLSVLSQAIGCSRTLQRLSLANSMMGDGRLQLLAKGLCNCTTLQILDLSRCALSDSSHVSLTSLLKASVGLNAEAEWQSSLRGCEGKIKSQNQALHRGLYALDLSFNFLTDTSAKHICTALSMGAPLAALNLQGNQMQRKTMKRFLSVYEMWSIPQILDLRDNLDHIDVGVLEKGEHLSFFSGEHEPFWKKDGIQISKDFPTNSDVLKKESSTLLRNECIHVCKRMSNPTITIRDVFDNSMEMMEIKSQVEEIMSLSPLLDVDSKSADVIPVNILPTRTSLCNERNSELLCSLASTVNSITSLCMTSPLPRCDYLSTPSDNSDDSYLYQDHTGCTTSSEVDIIGVWNWSSSSINDAKSDVHFSPGNISHKVCQTDAHSTEYNQPIHQHMTLHNRFPTLEMEYPNNSIDPKKQTSATNTQLSEAIHDNIEWDAFMNDMTVKLLQVQDEIDVALSFAKPDFLITTQTTLITLQEGIQQLLTLET